MIYLLKLDFSHFHFVGVQKNFTQEILLLNKEIIS